MRNSQKITEVDSLEDKSVDADLVNRFNYHSPKPGQPKKYEYIRGTLLNVASIIDNFCPNSREKALAITKLEEAMFWANASIARNNSDS
jgi:hypothetical protein